MGAHPYRAYPPESYVCTHTYLAVFPYHVIPIDPTYPHYVLCTHATLSYVVTLTVYCSPLMLISPMCPLLYSFALLL